jgi:multiple sugar transport system ATP-binding protein
VAGVVFDGVTKVYADGTKAVDGLDLDVTDGEFMVLVGPSGCGKTTALRMVAGLEDISGGVLKIGERIVNHVPSRDRDIAMVFQSYALYPHLSVYENIAFGLKIKKLPKAEIEKRVSNAARILGLEAFLKRKPRALSGGQRQRVAMGRAIVREPAAFLMDEPLSNLDAKLRVQMRAEIAALQHDLGVTTIYVTHDQVEAMTMGDRVAVMRKGELQQVADPQTLYDQPVNLFVGGFIGSPAMNMIEATLASQNGGYAAKVGEQALEIDSETLKARPGLAAYDGRSVVLGIRPEDLEDAALVPSSDGSPRLQGKTELTEALGSEVMVHFAIKARHAVTDDVRELAQDVGDERRVSQLAEGDTATLVGRFGARSRVHVGEDVQIAVDTRSLHFFDPDTGLGIYGDPEQATKGAAS